MKLTKKIIAVSCSLALVATAFSVTPKVANAEETEKSTIVAFNYTIADDAYSTTTDDATGEVTYVFADGSKDLDEYAMSKDSADENSYVYNATTGNGKLTASVNGTALKHVSWSQDDVFVTGEVSIMQPVVSASTTNLWSKDAYVKLDLDASNSTDLELSFDLGATKKGPSSYYVYYISNEEIVQIGETITLKSNKTMYPQKVTLPENFNNSSSVEIYIGITNTTSMAGKEITNTDSGKFAINNIVLSGIKENIDPTTDATTVEVTTVDATTADATTAEVTTADTTTAEVTTAPTKEEVKPGNVSIKKATKKKSAKKAVVTLVTNKSANGYKVSIFKTKKNAKKLKKALATIVTKKNIAKVVIKSKKIKNAKKLFVRACAYVKDGKNMNYGAWSKVKAVKVK